MYQEITFIQEHESPPLGEHRLAWLDPARPTYNGAPTPYYGFIGNEHAVKTLQPIDFEAWGRANHDTSGVSIAFLGPPGAGKRELARRHNRARLLPYCQVEAGAVQGAHDLAQQIIGALAAHTPSLRVATYANPIVLPPCDVLIQDPHRLSPGLVEGVLLASEPSGERMLRTEQGWSVDCKQVHWMVAAANRKRLHPLMDARFLKIELALYTKEQIAEIVKLRFPAWPDDASRLVAHYRSRLPGEALDFAERIEQWQLAATHWSRPIGKKAHERPGYLDGIARLAPDCGIDEYGMSFQRLGVLKAIAGGPVAENQLAGIIGCDSEALETLVLPWLLASTPDQPALVAPTSNGYAITEAGRAELSKRGLAASAKEKSSSTGPGARSAGRPEPTTDLLRTKLSALIAQFGRSLADDPRRLQGWLLDYCPRDRPRVRILVESLKLGIATDMAGGLEAGLPTGMILPRLIRRLENELQVTEEIARWAVESWAMALVPKDDLQARSSGRHTQPPPPLQSASIAGSQQTATVSTPAPATPQPPSISDMQFKEMPAAPTLPAKAGVRPLQAGESYPAPQAGEAELVNLLWTIFDRTQGKPTQSDKALVVDLMKQKGIPSKRAQEIIDLIREQWRVANATRRGSPAVQQSTADHPCPTGKAGRAAKPTRESSRPTRSWWQRLFQE